MIGSFAVEPGEELSIVVGERGFDATEGDLASGGGGGGGGSFVWRAESKELLIAAGGGGGSAPLGAGEPHFFGQDGVTTEDGTGSRSHDEFGDAPGGTEGGDGQAVSGSGGHGWESVLEDPSGQAACAFGGDGGFGGGGGSGCAPNPCEPENHGRRWRRLLGRGCGRLLRLLRRRRWRLVQQRRQAGQLAREDRGRRLRDDQLVSTRLTARAAAVPRPGPDDWRGRDRGTS